jgi:hypothetical protein
MTPKGKRNPGEELVAAILVAVALTWCTALCGCASPRPVYRYAYEVPNTPVPESTPYCDRSGSNRPCWRCTEWVEGTAVPEQRCRVGYAPWGLR